jgi:hypothetical protein
MRKGLEMALSRKTLWIGAGLVAGIAILVLIAVFSGGGGGGTSGY